MKKISLIVILIAAMFSLQNCKKDTVTATAQSTKILAASINDSTWTPDTLTATVTYNSAAKNKTFAVSGTYNTKQINFAGTIINTNTQGFPLTTFVSDATSNLTMFFLRQNITTKAFVSQGATKQGAILTVSAIDSVKRLITGTFAFSTIKTNTDSNGNITSIVLNQISGGQFNNMPYTYKSN